MSAAGKRVSTDEAEIADWLDALSGVLSRSGPQVTSQLMGRLQGFARLHGVALPHELNSPYVNTIPSAETQRYPGDVKLEQRIKSIIRWNAMAMVVRANREHEGIGGHISTYASAATLLEVAFNHFFRAPREGKPGDIIYFQGHASPGIYARAFLEGHFTESELEHFRRESGEARGLSSYPHPWLMPDFWQAPSVSMGLSPIMSIYQARFLRYLADRGLADTSEMRVWCFLGDGECDEPEALGAISLAAREGLDNLTFVVNCNLQRLDGPVRGNGKIIQELERSFRGAGWYVNKVIWGSNWDPLLDADKYGLLVERMNQVVDGDFQKYVVEGGAYIRRHFFGTSQALQAMVDHLSDGEIQSLCRGGHDPRKVFSAYQAAVSERGRPSVVLAKTIKGYGLGEAGEGRNVTHQQKKLNEHELREFRSRFGIPIGDERVVEAPFFKPGPDSPEMKYLRERRESLGGFLPRRRDKAAPLPQPAPKLFSEFYKGSGDRPVATTMAFVRVLDRLLRDDDLGALVVPIVPDEARTFGMDSLFHRYGIYSTVGQRYEPVDRESLLYYREATDGQILEEGISEAGTLSSFIAAGTSSSTLGLQMVPFAIFYSMFGFQRVGDLIWAAADSRARGFLLGGTAGRTTLAGEGLQHQDGHSHLLASAVPNVCAYDPAFAYELAVIIGAGIGRMTTEKDPVIYYITLYNESYPMPSMPDDCEQDILEGMYRLTRRSAHKGHVQLLASGPIVREALRAQEILEQRYSIGSEVWSVTSYSELRRRALEAERWNMLHPAAAPRQSYLERVVRDLEGPFIAVSDYVKLVAEQIARWLPAPMTALGTDGFGLSDTRDALRRYFAIDAEHIVLAALGALTREGRFSREQLASAVVELGIDPEQPGPMNRSAGQGAPQ